MIKMITMGIKYQNDKIVIKKIILTNRRIKMIIYSIELKAVEVFHESHNTQTTHEGVLS